MTDRILSDEEVDPIPTYHNRGVIALKASHRLLLEKLAKKKAALKDRGVIESLLEICEEERDALKARVKELEGILQELQDAEVRKL